MSSTKNGVISECKFFFISSVLETQSQKHTHKSWCWVLNQSGPSVPLRTRQPPSKASCPRCWEAAALPAAGVGMEVEMSCTRPPLPRQMTKNVFTLTKEVWHTLRRSAAKACSGRITHRKMEMLAETIYWIILVQINLLSSHCSCWIIFQCEMHAGFRSGQTALF